MHPEWPEELAYLNKHMEPDPDDPFTNPTSTYTTTGTDRYQAPSAYGICRHAWVHIFPEGKIHQHPDRFMRYLKWGVARLILESESCPNVVPMWIEGPDEVMHESRTWLRFIPRILGKNINVTFGESVSEALWEGFRERWQLLKAREMKKELGSFLEKNAPYPAEKVEFLNDELRYGLEAKRLRMEVTFAVREEILKLRRKRGLPDEDPKARVIDTFRDEGGKKEGKMDDESWIKDT
jgi:monolysocardiolipin acyltransferase